MQLAPPRGLDADPSAGYPTRRLSHRRTRGDWIQVLERVAPGWREAAPPLASQVLGPAHAGALKQAWTRLRRRGSGKPIAAIKLERS